MSRFDVPIIVSIEARTETEADTRLFDFMRAASNEFGIQEKIIDWSYNQDWLNRESYVQEGGDI